MGIPFFRQRHPVTGKVMFDTYAGDRAAIIIGQLTIDYASNPTGSIDVPALQGATPFVFRRGTAYEGTPAFTISGTTLTWARTPYSNGQYPQSGVYEVFYGGINLITLGAPRKPYISFRAPNSDKIVFTTAFGMLAHNGMASVSGKITDYQNADGFRILLDNNAGPSRMIAMRPTSYAVAPMGTYYSSNGAVGNAVATIKGGSPAGQYYVIEKPTILPARPGITGRSAATGELTFSTAQQCMRAVDVINGTPGTWTGTPGRIYAAIFSGPIIMAGDEVTDTTMDRGQLVIGDDPPYYQFAGYALSVQVRADNPHILDFDWLWHSGANYGVKKSDPQGMRYYNGTIIIVDVTDL